jgi:hypothetical protein
MTHTIKNKFGDMIEIIPIRLSDLPNFIVVQNPVTQEILNVHSSCIITTFTPEEKLAYAKRIATNSDPSPVSNPT